VYNLIKARIHGGNDEVNIIGKPDDVIVSMPSVQVNSIKNV